MARTIVYLVLFLAITSCSNEETKEFSFLNFSSKMNTKELIRLPGLRTRESFPKDTPEESYLYFDRKDTDGYTLLIQKNQQDHSYAMKVIYNIPADISMDEAEADVVNRYKGMGTPIKYKEKSYGVTTSMRSKSIVFGCSDCAPSVDVDCYYWYKNLDHRMQLCASIYEQISSSRTLRWINLYWYDFTEAGKLEEFRHAERDRVRSKMKF